MDCSKTNKHVPLREGNHFTSNSSFTIRKLRERLCNTRQTHGLWSRVHNMTTVIIFKEKNNCVFSPKHAVDHKI